MNRTTKGLWRLAALGAVLLSGCATEEEKQDERDTVQRFRECQAKGGIYLASGDGNGYYAPGRVCFAVDSVIPLTGGGR